MAYDRGLFHVTPLGGAPYEYTVRRDGHIIGYLKREGAERGARWCFSAHVWDGHYQDGPWRPDKWEAVDELAALVPEEAMRPHEPAVQHVGRMYQAVCPCGWRGDTRASFVNAERDRDRHARQEFVPVVTMPAGVR